MPRKQKLYNILKVLFLASCLWLIILLIIFFYPSNQDQLESFHPNDANISLSINTNSIAKQVFYDIFYKSKGDELNAIDLKGNVDNFETYGIDFNPGVVYFTKEHNNNTAYGFVVPVKNKSKFSQLKSKNSQLIIKEYKGKGIILFLDENTSSTERSYFKNYIENALTAVTTDTKAKLKQETSLQLRLKEDENYNNTTINLDLQQSSIKLNGFSKRSNKTSSTSNSVVKISPLEKENHLSFEMNELPSSAQKIIQDFIYQTGVRTPNIEQAYFHFYKTKIENIRGRSLITPKFDAVFTFDSLFNFKESLYSVDNSKYQITHTDKDAFFIGDVLYHYQQISENSIYIGINPHPEIRTEEKEKVLSIYGDPSVILEIEGESFAVKLINFLPHVREPKRLLSEVSFFDLKVVEEGPTLKIEGEMTLTEDKIMSLELLSLLQTLFI